MVLQPDSGESEEAADDRDQIRFHLMHTSKRGSQTRRSSEAASAGESSTSSSETRAKSDLSVTVCWSEMLER